MKGKRIGETHRLLLVLAAIAVTGCGTKGQNSLADSGGDLMAPDVARLEVVDDLGRPDVPPAGNDADSTKLDDIVDILPTEIPLHDVDTVEVPDVPLPDTDISDVDSNPFPDEPLLCGYQFKEKEYPYNNPYHLQEGLGVSYDPNLPADRVVYYPKRMWLLPDGKTLRVAVLWLNGAGVSVGNAEGVILPEHAYSTYCWNPVKTVLPSGFVYWDVNTETQEVTFLGETVLAPSDYEGFSYGEPFNVVATQFEPDNSVKWLMEVPVGEDTYQFSACPLMGYYCKQDSYPSSGGFDPMWESWAQVGAVDPPTLTVQNYFDIVFSRREIWSLRRFGPKGEFEQTIPLPVSVHQLPEEKILRSGCACEHSVPAVDWSCSKDGPYICGLSKLVEPPYEYCRCSGGGKLEEMPPPEDQIERPRERVYFTPYEGENGLFALVRVEDMLYWIQFANMAGLQCQQDGTGTINSWPSLDADDQMIETGPFLHGALHQFPEQCASYVCSYTPDPEHPFWSCYLPCYRKKNSLCGGVNTCIEKLSVDWSFQGLVSFRTSQVVLEPDSYPDATLFISMHGLDPRVPCDLDVLYNVPLWDW